MNYAYNTPMSVFIGWFLDETPRPDYWEDLYSEYISLRENKSSLYILGLIKEITGLKSKYKIVGEACTMLTLCFDNQLIEAAATIRAILREYNHRQAFDMSNPAHFSRDIRAVLSGNKKLITTWQRKEQELQVYQDKHAGKAWDRKGFFVWAITLGEHQKYRVDLDIVTVAEWCMMLNQYEKYCEVVNAQQNSKNYGKH